jgi:3-oxoacyl-ACP reductase-like protein
VTERGLSKEEKRQAREVATAAHYAELSAALEELAVLFADWHKGRIDAFQLADAIHQFHDGQSRELFNRYRGGLRSEDLAARAIAWELVAPSEIPRALRTALADRVERWRRRT